MALVLASSPWLVAAALAASLRQAWRLDEFSVGLLSSALQAGFIAGTLTIARTGLADARSPKQLFVIGALLTAASNLAFAWCSSELYGALALRCLTGVSLALVYPIALRLAASWFESDRGWVLGWVIGALTLGSAAPHLLLWLLDSSLFPGAGSSSLDWRPVASIASAAAVVGALLVAIGTRDGPHLAIVVQARQGVPLSALWSRPAARAVMLAYFGHMWELYALWSAVGAYVASSPSALSSHAGVGKFVTFVAIGSGVLGCVLGAIYSRRAGERRVAAVSLWASALCCIASPWAHQAPLWLLVGFVCIWGATVIADSAQFAALLTVLSPGEAVGSSILWMNAIGFGITIFSIQLVAWIADHSSWQFALVALAPGPLLGLMALRRVPEPRSISSTPWGAAAP